MAQLFHSCDRDRSGRIARRLLWRLLLTLGVPATPLRAQLPAPAVAASAPLQWGGYGSLVLTRPDNPRSGERGEVSELAAALLVWGQLAPRASYFVELDVATRTSDTWTGREADRRFVPMRAYFEYSYSDALRLRVGRFLTPIGQWNEAHAEPLTWTPTRPLTTYRAFSKSLNGLLAGGTLPLGGRDVGYALYWAPAGNENAGLDRAEESTFVSALGGRAAAELRPGVVIGVSAARARRSRPRLPEDESESSLTVTSRLRGRRDGEDGERDDDETGRAILGGDIGLTRSRFELRAEGVWVAGVEGQPDEGGAFVLGALNLSGPLWAVAKGEVYRPVDGRRVSLGFLGATLRRGPRLVIKAGYQLSDHPSIRVPDGWFLSFSSLF